MSRFSLDLPQHARRVAGDDRPGGHVSGDYAAGPDDRVLANLDSAEDRRAGADSGAAAHDRRHHGPVAVALELAALVHGAREAIVDEHHAVSNEDVILDLDTFADEGMARNLDAAANLRALLDFDECTDARFVADLTAVQVDELVDLDVLAKLDVRRDRLKRHSVTRWLPARSERSAASSSVTTRTPAAPSVNGARRWSMASANSRTTKPRASRRSNVGAYMPPVRYDTRIWRRVSPSRTSTSTPLS